MNRSTQRSTEKKDKKINLRMSYELYHKIEQDAKDCSTKNISEYIRNRLSEAPVVQTRSTNVVQDEADSTNVVQDETHLTQKDPGSELISHLSAKDPKPPKKGLRKIIPSRKKEPKKDTTSHPLHTNPQEMTHYYIPPQYKDQDQWAIIWDIILHEKYPPDFPEGWDIYNPHNTLKPFESEPEPISLTKDTLSMLQAHNNASNRTNKPAMLRSSQK